MQKLLYIFHASIVIVTSLSFLIDSVVFVVKFISIDIEGCLFGVLQVNGNASMLNMIVYAIINRKRIAAIYTKLSEICALSKLVHELPISIGN